MSAQVDKMVRVYIRIRDERTKLQQEYDAADAVLKEQLEAIEGRLLEMCKRDGVEGFKTPFGSVSRRTKTRYWPADWAEMHKWIKEHDALEMLEKRLAQGNMKKYLEENPDDAPPGLQVDSSYAVTITRPRNRA